MSEVDIAGFGEAMVLFEADSFETASAVDVHVAGAELNLCAAAARLGLRAALCTRVGADPLGARILGELRRLRISDDLVQVDPAHPTGLFLKEVRPDGQRRVNYYRRGSAASQMDSTDAARLLACRPRIIAISGITAALGPTVRAAVADLAATLGSGSRTATADIAGKGRLAFDPNLRPALGDMASQVDFARELLPQVDILLLGVDEAELLFGTTDPEEVFRAFPGEIVLKAGPDGCFHRGDDGRPVHLPSLATSIVDPVGAGDAFGGGYLAARLRGASPAHAARVGSTLAAGVVATRGDTEGLPSSEAARRLLEIAGEVTQH